MDLAIPVESLPAELDMYPSRLRRRLEAKLGDLTAEFDRVVVAYGRCCPLIDDLVMKCKAQRLPGESCYEILGGSEFAEQRGLDGAYYLTPFLCRTFERVTSNAFGNIAQMKVQLSQTRTLVYLDTGMDPRLVGKAGEIASALAMNLEIRPVGLKNLQDRLVLAFNEENRK